MSVELNFAITLIFQSEIFLQRVFYLLSIFLNGKDSLFHRKRVSSVISVQFCEVSAEA